MGGRDADLAGILAVAALQAHLAAILEVAVVRHIDGVGDLAGDGIELVDLLADHRLGSHQADGVGVGGMREDLLRRALLHDASRIHDHHIVRHLGDNAQIVGDEHDGGVDLILQVAQQIEDLRLNGHVQRRGGLVGNDQAGIARQCHGDHDTLTHTTGQLVGEVFIHTLAVGDAHHLQQLDGALLDLLLVEALLVVEGQNLVELVANAEHRVQRRHGLLEDHGNEVAAQMLHHTVRRLRDVVGLVAQIQADLTLHDLTLRTLQKLHDGQAGHGLAAAGLAHDAHRLTHGDVEGNAVHGVHCAHVGKEVGVQVVDFQNVGGVLHLGQILALGYVLTLVLLFQLIGDLTIFFGDAAGFLCGKIAVILLFSHF